MKEKATIINKVPFYLASLILICLNISTIKSRGFSAMIPCFDVIIIFYCILVKSFFGFWWISFIAIWQDAILEIPIGISAISYLLTIKIVENIVKNPIKESNSKNLIHSFTTFLIIFFLIKLTLLKFLTNDKVNILELSIQMILTIIIYPICNKLLNYSSNKILKERY